MAAPMRLGKMSFAKKCFSSVSINHLKSTLTRCSSNLVSSEEVTYPPVKPKYPPGLWGEIKPEKAWERYEIRETLMSKATAKWRLEEMAGSLPGKIMWIANSVDPQPGTLPYKQYITKTHLERELPEMYKISDDGNNLQKLVDRVRSQVEDVILLEQELCIRERAVRPLSLGKKDGVYYRQRAVRQIIDVLINNASYDGPHLLESQVDGNVTVESFWHRIKCGDESDRKTFGRYKYGDGRLWFQGSHKPCLQIRTELPLPEFLSMDDEMCSGQVQNVTYSPAVYGMAHLRRRSFSSPGHWQEDPCEFTLLSASVPSFRFELFLQMFGERFYDEASTNYGMTGAFLSCAAQAHNQGFNWLMDLTYPFTTQSIVSDGQWFQFMAYQLNTLRMWVDDDVNSLRNICWSTERMPLYETIENRRIRGFNDDVLKLLLRFVLKEPQDRGINLRPYLPQELSPAKRKEKYINLKGEEPLPFTERPGQTEYPINSVYFQQNI